MSIPISPDLGNAHYMTCKVQDFHKLLKQHSWSPPVACHRARLLGWMLKLKRPGTMATAVLGAST